jgi:hypothetical protein
MAGQFKALLEDMADSDKLSRANRAFLTRMVGDFRTEKVLDTIQAKLRLPSFPPNSPNSPISIFITLLPWARDIAEGTKNIEEWARETNSARAMWLEFAEAAKRLAELWTWHLSLIAQGQDLPLLPTSQIRHPGDRTL